MTSLELRAALIAAWHQEASALITCDTASKATLHRCADGITHDLQVLKEAAIRAQGQLNA